MKIRGRNRGRENDFYFENFIIKIKHHFYSRIRFKMILFFITVALIPLILFGYTSYKKSSSIVNKQFNEYEGFAVSQLEKQIENMLDQMYVISNDIQYYLSDPTLTVIKEEIPTTYTGFIEKAEL